VTRGAFAACLLASACAVAGPIPERPTPNDLTGPQEPCGPYGDDAPAEGSPAEARAWGEVSRALRAPGAKLLRSGALDRAARILAAQAGSGVEQPLARRRVQGALRAAGSYDPAPTAHLSSGPPDDALAALLVRAERGGATHAGIAVREEGGAHHVVLLLARRRARLDRLPGSVAAGAEARLRGELLGLLHPRAWVTRPDGASEEIALGGDRAFSAALRFPLPGRYTIEVLGTGDRGPEVAALLAVSAGGASCEPGDAGPSDPLPADRRPDEERLLDSVNRLRRARGLAELRASPELSEVARRHSQRMLAAGTVAHVLPGGGELADRLGAARIPFRRAWENVASGESALDAHAAAESSPAHRANLLVPAAERLGLGVARGALPTGEAIAYLTEILVEPPADGGADRLTPDARVREVLWRERERRALPALTNDPSLEALARGAAAAMREADDGRIDGLAEGALRLGRELAAADAFIASSPAEAIRSRNLTDARFRRVGVGVVIGESRRFGPGRLFIAVVYSD
jgi:uncharacterized protein YkwD